jgi:predicted amidohydrolase
MLTTHFIVSFSNTIQAHEVLTVNGIRLGLLNCYAEAEFPELTRILALKGAQVVLIPTAADLGTYDHHTKLWPNWAYPDVARTIINANAYHNRIFCAYINHALYQFRSDGETMSGIYLGNSTVADPLGQTMVIAENVETMLITDCIPTDCPPTHPGGQSDFIRDRRPELYSQLTSTTVVRNATGTTHVYPTNPNDRKD